TRPAKPALYPYTTLFRSNSTGVNQNVIIQDITPPATLTLAEVTGECSASVTAPATTDNCAGVITGITTDPLSYNTPGTHVVHWRSEEHTSELQARSEIVS